MLILKWWKLYESFDHCWQYIFVQSWNVLLCDIIFVVYIKVCTNLYIKVCNKLFKIIYVVIWCVWAGDWSSYQMSIGMTIEREQNVLDWFSRHYYGFNHIVWTWLYGCHQIKHRYKFGITNHRQQFMQVLNDPIMQTYVYVIVIV